VGKTVLLASSLPLLVVRSVRVLLRDIVELLLERDRIGNVGRLHLSVLRRDVFVRKHLEFHLLRASSLTTETANRDECENNDTDDHQHYQVGRVSLLLQSPSPLQVEAVISRHDLNYTEL
jgi:hypothetical protein